MVTTPPNRQRLLSPPLWSLSVASDTGGRPLHSAPVASGASLPCITPACPSQGALLTFSWFSVAPPPLRWLLFLHLSCRLSVGNAWMGTSGPDLSRDICFSHAEPGSSYESPPVTGTVGCVYCWPPAGSRVVTEVTAQPRQIP